MAEPDGKKIAFVNNGSLLVMNTDGNDQLELRKHSSAWAAWSPDGSRVVFCRGTQIFVMDASGANASPLGEGFGEDYQPAWGKK